MDKYIKVFQREYNISRQDILINYSWDDIQEYVNALPIERVITTYDHKKADNKNRYLEALCNRNDQQASEAIDLEAEAFRERRKKYFENKSKTE